MAAPAVGDSRDAFTAGAAMLLSETRSLQRMIEMADSLRDPECLWQYEPYLRMLARVQMRRALQAKVGASDIVQQSLLQAVQALDDFRGQSEAELRGWLRQILARNIAHLDRDMHRDKRDVRRERSIEQRLSQSSLRLEGWLAAGGPTPSQHVALGERVLLLSAALERLPATQRDAVRMHYLEGMKLGEVATRLDKTTGAVAGLLHRGLKTLRNELAAAGSQSRQR